MRRESAHYVDRPQNAWMTLAEATERNFADLQTAYAQAVGGEVLDLPDVRFSASGLPTDLLNTVNIARLSPSTARDRIAEAIAFFARLGAPFLWLVGPASTPPDLPERLQMAGLTRLVRTPAMALDL